MTTLAKLATAPASTVSDKYVFLSTEQAHSVLADFGFYESRYKQSRGTGDSAGFQKHVSIFERETDTDEDGRFNLMLLNSHNGTSALRLEAGYFRLLCENQLGSGDVGVRVSHRGSALDRFAEAVPLVLMQMESFKETKQLLRDKTLNTEAMLELAQFALMLRGVKQEELREFFQVRNQQNMLTRRRFGDSGQSAWHRFNVIQENMVKGCRVFQTNDKFQKLRPLTNAERLIDLNNQLTAKTLELVRAAA
jgi:hypothetical protein